MVAVNPEQPDWPVPARGHILRWGAMNLHLALDSGAAKCSQEIIEGRGLPSEHRIGDGRGRMRIDADDRTKAATSGYRSQRDSGFPLEAANFNGHALLGRTRGQQAKSTEFEFANVAGDRSRAFPRMLNDGVKVF